jgi:DNA-directed RNA polymerase specialized sigma24 family protein
VRSDLAGLVRDSEVLVIAGSVENTGKNSDRLLSFQTTRLTFGALQEDRSEVLPQLYRFCFLMMGDAAKAQEVFQATMHELALRSAGGEVPNDPLWLFRDARGRCLEASEAGLQAEPSQMAEHPIRPAASSQIEKLEPTQLAVWISGAPEPQRTALALFYLDFFDHGDLLAITELKPSELGPLIADARQQFQAWLDMTMPEDER